MYFFSINLKKRKQAKNTKQIDIHKILKTIKKTKSKDKKIKTKRTKSKK